MRDLYLLLFLIIFCGYVNAQHSKIHPHKIDDNLRNHAANRLINMTYELVIESKLLQRQLHPLQDYYQGQITYEIGYVMGKIRDRYKRMIEIYKQAHYMTKHIYLDHTNTTHYGTTNKTAMKPGLELYYPINWVINMEYMRLYEVDIDKMVEVLENIPSAALAHTLNAGNVAGPSEPDPGEGPPGGNPLPPFIPPPYTPGSPDGQSKPPRGIPVRSGRSGVGVLRSQPPTFPKEPIVSNESLGFTNDNSPIVPNESLGFTNDTPAIVTKEPPLSDSKVLPLRVPNELPPSFPNEPAPSVASEQPLGQSNELPSDSARQSYIPPVGPQSQSYDLSPNFPYETPLGQPYEPPPELARQSYETPNSRFIDLPPSRYEPPPGQPNEPLRGRPSEPPPGQPNEPPPDQPNEPPPDQPNEPQQWPQSWPTVQPAASDGKIIRFGSADSHFRNEEELKRYYREKYRQSHDGMTDKYDNLYR